MRILSLGAGVQSTTLYLTEEWDYAVFADTQEEPAPVYTHLAWMKSLGRAPIIERTAGKLGDDLQYGRGGAGRRVACIPAFTLIPGQRSRGKIMRQCTSDYKLDVIHQAVRELLGLQRRQRFPKWMQIIMGIGFSDDEQGRAGRVLAGWKRPQIMPVFPLITKRWRRDDCVEYLRTVVPHEVPRSSCVFCPFHGDEEWRWLRSNDPAGWERAVEIDLALRIPGNVVNRNVRAEMFLHRDCVPLDQVDLSVDDRQGEIAFEGCTGGCAG